VHQVLNHLNANEATTNDNSTLGATLLNPRLDGLAAVSSRDTAHST
jgi:hypothetical protein